MRCMTLWQYSLFCWYLLFFNIRQHEIDRQRILLSVQVLQSVAWEFTLLYTLYKIDFVLSLLLLLLNKSQSEIVSYFSFVIFIKFAFFSLWIQEQFINVNNLKNKFLVFIVLNSGLSTTEFISSFLTTNILIRCI